MSRFTAKILLFALTWGFFAPLANALAPVPPHACCLRKTAHCHEHAQMAGMAMDSMAMNMGASSTESAPAPVVRAPDCCGQGSCCRGLSSNTFALRPAASAQPARVLSIRISLRESSPRGVPSATSHEVRGPPAL